MHHDERGIDAVGSGIEKGCLGDIQLGDDGPIEGSRDFGVQTRQPRKLCGSSSECVALEQEANPSFPTQQRQYPPDDVVHTRNSSQGLQGCPVCRVLPAYGRNLGESLARPCCRQSCAHCRLEGWRCGTVRVTEEVVSLTLHASHLPLSSSARSRSPIKSSVSSTPQLRRTRLSVSPIALRIAGGTEAWVIEAGWPMRLSTPPSDSASAKMRVFSTNRRARSGSPRSRAIIPPKPVIWRQASSC